jgi:hypothetical protein
MRIPAPALLRHFRQMVFVIVAAVFTGILLLAIFVTPSITRWASERRNDWAVLSDVGQSYGGISALLSALALAAIAVSTVLQWRQTKVTLLSSASAKHFELVRLAFEHDEIPVGAGLDRGQFAQRAFANLTVSHWLMVWELGVMDDSRVVRASADLFRHPAARSWWETVSGHWAPAPTKRNRKFVALVDAGFRLAPVPEIVTVPAAGSGKRVSVAVATACGVAAIAVYAAVRRRGG